MIKHTTAAPFAQALRRITSIMVIFRQKIKNSLHEGYEGIQNPPALAGRGFILGITHTPKMRDNNLSASQRHSKKATQLQAKEINAELIY
jgi:hypothetical protein